ncbi:MAG: Lactoylglutathione lyase [Trizodia sp. TS-e1964]|nr:MAG: Lactoylglutathione lyase [Trizodia sp. TS-e1964]
MATMATDTSTYKLNHTMLRVKDPKESLKFYEFLGLKLLNEMKFPDNKFDLYFLGFDSSKATNHGKHWTDRDGILELTHNYGTENDASYKISNGNSDPGRGFGHVCISVDNIIAACDRIEAAGYKFQKRLSDGQMKTIAFALDPDGYWVELLGKDPGKPKEVDKATDIETYRLNHTMIRVKDAEKSLEFYKNVMGMHLLRTIKQSEAKFNLYFLGYKDSNTIPLGDDESSKRTGHLEGLLELTWNYGTESDKEFKYYDGNAEPQGFGHICISVDDIDKACNRFEDLKVNWKKRLTDGRMKNVAFILDPDGYWIEVLQNETLKPGSGL